MKNLLITIVLSGLFINGIFAQSSEVKIQNIWGAEINLVWPFVPGVGIYTAKITKTVWKSGKMKGDILAAVLLRPGTKNDPNAEIFKELGVGIGYRQYFTKGLHAELMLFPSFATELNNKIDGKDYSSLAITTELYLGYKFDLIKKEHFTFYLMPQAGLGMNVYSDLGPESEANAPFPVISLQAGFNF